MIYRHRSLLVKQFYWTVLVPFEIPKEVTISLSIQDNDKLVAMLLKYDPFMAMRRQEEGTLVVDYPKQDPELMVKVLTSQGEDGFELGTAIGRSLILEGSSLKGLRF